MTKEFENSCCGTKEASVAEKEQASSCCSTDTNTSKASESPCCSTVAGSNEVSCC